MLQPYLALYNAVAALLAEGGAAGGAASPPPGVPPSVSIWNVKIASACYSHLVGSGRAAAAGWVSALPKPQPSAAPTRRGAAARARP